MKRAPSSFLAAPNAGLVQRWQDHNRFLTMLVVAFIIFAILHALDAWAWHYFRHPELKTTLWYKALRQVGSLPIWFVAAGVLVVIDAVQSPRRAECVRAGWPSDIWQRAKLLILSAGLSGLAAELFKYIIARERPVADGLDIYQGHVFRMPLSGFWDASNLGLPSSHTAVAFGGAFAMARLVPGSRPIVILLALGCAWTRLIAGAHFLTDVFGGIVLAYAVMVMLQTPVPRRCRP